MSCTVHFLSRAIIARFQQEKEANRLNYSASNLETARLILRNHRSIHSSCLQISNNPVIEYHRATIHYALAMSSNTDTKPDSKEEQVPSAEPTTSLAGKESTTNVQAPQDASVTSEEKPKTTYTEMAQSATTSASSAAAGVKDSVFSMFGGGAKKEKREEPEDAAAETSGSSKSKRDAEAAEADKEGEEAGVRWNLHHTLRSR